MNRHHLMALLRAPLVVLVLTLAATLPAVAHASPPDPSWISGVYDDADYDDVILLVTSGTGDVSPALPADLPPLRPLAGRLVQISERAPVILRASAVRPRAPPAP